MTSDLTSRARRRRPRRPDRLAAVTTGVAVAAAAAVLTACTASSGSGSAGHTPSPSSTATAPSTASSGASGTAATGSGPGTAAGSGGATAASSGTTAGGGPAAPAPANGDLRTAAPVPIAGTGDFGGGVTATIAKSEDITGQARLPGEIAGPAVRLTVHVTNGGAQPLDLGSATVDLQDHNGVSASPLTGNGSVPFAGALAPGASADGVYVFTLATGDRSGVRLLLTFSTSLPVVVFSGTL